MKAFLLVTLFIFGLVGSGSCTPKQEAGKAQDASPPMSAQEAETVAPKQSETIFQNDYVEVIDFRVQPGEKIPPHGGAKRVACPLGSYRIKYSEGKEQFQIDLQEGDVHWHECIEHSVENVGKNPAHFITVNRKEAPLPEFDVNALEQDAFKVAPDHSRVLMDNPNVRVLHITLMPKEKIPTHQGIYRVIYPLTDYQIAYGSEEGSSNTKTFKAGQVHWHEPGEHWIENIGDAPAEFMLFSWKQ